MAEGNAGHRPARRATGDQIVPRPVQPPANMYFAGLMPMTLVSAFHRARADAEAMRKFRDGDAAVRPGLDRPQRRQHQIVVRDTMQRRNRPRINAMTQHVSRYRRSCSRIAATTTAHRQA
jgi:hypothetical protein